MLLNGQPLMIGLGMTLPGRVSQLLAFVSRNSRCFGLITATVARVSAAIVDDAERAEGDGVEGAHDGTLGSWYRRLR